MKRVLGLVTLLVAMTATTMFATHVESVQFQTTKGLFLNSIDNGQDAVILPTLQKSYFSVGGIQALNTILWSGAAPGSWQAALGLVNINGMNFTLTLEDQESSSIAGVTVLNTNVIYTAPNKTTTVTSRQDDLDSPNRNFVLGASLNNMNAGLIFNWEMTGSKRNATYNVNGTTMTVTVDDNSVAETVATNTGTPTGVKTIRNMTGGYNDSYNYTYAFTGGITLDKLSVYAPLTIDYTGTEIRGIETNRDEVAGTPTYTNQVEQYQQNDKRLTLTIYPEAWYTMNDNVQLIGGVKVGYGLPKNTTNKAYFHNWDENVNNTKLSSNDSMTLSNDLYLAPGFKAGAEFLVKASDKVSVKMRPMLEVGWTLTGSDYRVNEYIKDEMTATPVEYFATTVATASNTSAVDVSVTLPVAMEYKMVDSFTLRLASKFVYNYNASATVTKPLETYTNTTGVGGASIPITPAVTTSIYNEVLTASSSTTIEFGTGFSWKPVDNFIVDMALNTAVDGNALFNFGATSVIAIQNWNFQATYLF